jgi:putative Holliday junction resolvase
MEPTPSPPPRILALDPGKRRIGVAVSGPLNLAPRPLASVERISDQQAAEALARLMDEFEVSVCVVGLPLNMDGTEGPQARWVRSFVGRLRKERPAVAFKFQDERLTSFAADDLMRDRATPPAKRKGLRDPLAAMLILEDYLERRERSRE